MTQIRLPNTDLDVSLLSLGSADIGTKIDAEPSGRLFDAYLELGGNIIDTAHCYSFWIPGNEGTSERTIGKWLKESGARDKIVLSTKGGHPPMDGYPHDPDFLSYRSIAHDVAQSLERLGTDRIDLYYLHRDDGITPVDEIVDALNQCPELRYFGASNWSVERVAQANAYATRTGKRGFCALQNQWSLAKPCWRQEGEPSNKFISPEDRDRCAALNVAIHAYSATANGYFDSKADDGAFSGNGELRERVQRLAAEMDCTPTQIALAWLLSQPVTVVPIAGTTKIERLKTAAEKLDLRFSAEILNALSA